MSDLTYDKNPIVFPESFLPDRIDYSPVKVILFYLAIVLVVMYLIK